MTENVLILKCERNYVCYFIARIMSEPTTLDTSPALCIRADLIDWKKSTTPSVFNLSNWAWMHMNVPVRPTPSLLTSKSSMNTWMAQSFWKHCLKKLWYYLSTTTLLLLHVSIREIEECAHTKNIAMTVNKFCATCLLQSVQLLCVLIPFKVMVVTGV